MRIVLALVGCASLTLTAVAGCADGSAPPRRDAATMDAGEGRDANADANGRDATIIDAARDAVAYDGGHGSAGQCESCTLDSDCQNDMFCAPVTGGRACFAICNFENPTCPRGFQCVMNHSSTPAPVCQPVGERCCVDADGDLYGTGVGCLGTDCNDDGAANGGAIHPDATEHCDGVDEDCDGNVDEGDPAVLCVRPAHAATTACTGGGCSLTTCEPGFGDCDADYANGCERDVSTPSDCGGCDMPCVLPHSTAPTCDHGTCGLGTCDAGWGDCDGDDANGCETSLNTTTHCGTCTATCSPPNASATCDTGTCAVALCDRNWGDCDGRVINGCETPLVTNTDCGTCGTVCAPSSGAGSCSTGTCRVTNCANGFEDCDASSANGCETNIRTLSNCGACGLTCGYPNATASCAAGACTLVDCVDGYGNCDGNTGNGCETRTNTNASCGGCGVLCAPPNATGNCGTGTCAIAACNPGFADCDGLVANGCETSTRTLTDCGACHTACSRTGAVASCDSGTCSIGMCLATTGDCDGNDANGCETSVRTLSDCGACGVTCGRSNATATCASGSCAISSCMPGFSNCDGIDANGCETALNTLSSCGACGTPCARANATADCASGTCHILTCAAGFDNCDGVDANGCETPLNTLTNCGACRVGCNLTNASETCTNLTCEIVACSNGFDDCDLDDSNGCERSTRTLTDCGGCGVACGFANAGASCSSGTCTLGTCTSGYGNCDGNPANGCETPLNTLTSCGGCGISCGYSNAAASCATGTCSLGTCNTGYGNCDSIATNGCETSLRTLSDCGSCGGVCSFAHAAASCSAAGTCTMGSCDPGYGNCDGNMANGCETALNSLTDCGSCGTACGLAHGTASCASGTCSLTACSSGYGNCNGITTDGCETQLNSLTNCGSCGGSCSLANSTESCSTGACAIVSCNTGFANCDGNTTNGCETSTRTLTDCGSCGTVCSVPSGTPTCATGTCQVSSCASGFADCDGNAGNGCETSTRTLTNCGACGTACSLPNATSSCSTGTCTIAMCAAGYGDCDGLAANGCETPLNSLANCAACNVSCDLPNGSETCMTGSCTLTGCAALYGNCDGMGMNGCETALTSLTNCGGCGTACSLAHATSTCATGACAIASCQAGWGNCDGNVGNGCETPLNTVANCGSCGAGCSRPNATATCGTGTCAIGSCNSLYGNCDSNDPNGCETPLTSLTHCGGCGVACMPDHASGTCTTGTCQVGSCTTSWYNVDAMPGNGCECGDDTATPTCDGSTVAIGNVAVGATLTRNGVIPAVGGVDYYVVTFNGTGGTPTIEFSSNPSGVFRFDAFTGTCTTGSTCAVGENATSLTQWQFTDTFTPPDRSVPWPTTVYVRVTRSGAAQSCSPYTLRFTRP